MKKYFPAAILIAVTFIAFAACVFHKPTFSLVGKWAIDSTSLVKQYQKADSLGFPFLYMALTEKPVFVFGADSSLKEPGNHDTATQKYYYSDSSLFVNEDSIFKPYPLKVLNDSLIVITVKDSIKLTLIKQ